ncbi:restriction endonuclease subunit S [Aeromonas hydrophila]|uniref:restriction endonuclease subunit S n=1 Tax=Aeromonas hydrophila TaxID=644 RepID=UPI00398741C8
MAEQMKQNKAGEMTAKQAIPVGYKQTEVGVIPDDWVVSTMSSLTSLMTNGFVGTAKTHYTEAHDGVTYIQGYNVEENKFNFHGIKKVSAEFHRKNAKSCLRAGDLLMVQTGDVGLVTVVPPELEGANCHALIINRFRAEYNSAYFSFLFNSQQGRLRLKELETGTTMKHINVGDLLNFVVAYPPDKFEQTAIANVLSDTDELIDALEQLIAKKQAIKTATMQQLLTGRTRLPQFSLRPDGTPKGYKSSEQGQIPEDWCSRQIGQFAPLQRGFDLPSSKRVDGMYPVVYSNGIVNTHNRFQVKGPGVVTGRSGTLGKVHFIDGDYWPHNTSLWVTKFNAADPLFVFYLFGYIGFERFASGSGVPTLNRNDAHSFILAVPSLKEEQTAIAAILSDMDSELTALEQKLAKARSLKQGMMQQLLTGRIRLPLEVVA